MQLKYYWGREVNGGDREWEMGGNKKMEAASRSFNAPSEELNDGNADSYNLQANN